MSEHEETQTPETDAPAESLLEQHGDDAREVNQATADYMPAAVAANPGTEPPVVEEDADRKRWRRAGATDAELDRIDEENGTLDFETRYRNQVNMSGLSDQALGQTLEQYRQRWADGDSVVAARSDEGADDAADDRTGDSGTGPAGLATGADGEAVASGHADPDGEDAPATTAEDAQVPSGSVSDITSWVGNDKGRAQLALDRENQTGDPRSSLVTKLQKVLDS